MDQWDRSAVAFKYTTSCPGIEDVKEYAVAAFQRYTDDTKTWTYGGHHANDAADSIGARFKIGDNPWLENLISNKQETFTKYSWDDESSIQCNITLVGQETQDSSNEL